MVANRLRVLSDSSFLLCKRWYQDLPFCVGFKEKCNTGWRLWIPKCSVFQVVRVVSHNFSQCIWHLVVETGGHLSFDVSMLLCFDDYIICHTTRYHSSMAYKTNYGVRHTCETIFARIFRIYHQGIQFYIGYAGSSVSTLWFITILPHFANSQCSLTKDVHQILYHFRECLS